MWHTLDIASTFEITGSSTLGLTAEKVAERRAIYGPNEIKEKKKQPAWFFFLKQFKDFMIIVLMVAAVISGIVGDLTDTFIILIIIFLNAIVGFVQEYRAERAMEALKKMTSYLADVKRDGIHRRISSSLLVPGDIVLLHAGNVVPADIRLHDVHSLQIDESSITGESVAIEKKTEALTELETAIGDRINMAYKGTIVNKGRGTGIVVATGMQTEIGKIAGLLDEEDTYTPLQKRMADFGRKLSYIVLVICLIIFGIGLLNGEEPMQMLLLSISLAVAAIPEALPALITLALALGARRLVKQNALIRKLPAVETLGSVTYICSDKTGTLTLNKMKVVREMEINKDSDWIEQTSAMFISLALNHDVKDTAKIIISGDPTEIALVEFAREKFGKDKIENIVLRFPRIAEIPFDAERKCMTTIHAFNNRYLVLTKGAVESVFEKAKTSDELAMTGKMANEWAREGLRVLVFGYSILDILPDRIDVTSIEKNLTICGIVGLMDPPREEAKLAISECKSAGIRPVMITGDHPATASFIARETGILHKDDLVVSGKELEKMSAEELNSRVEKISVFARVSPVQKLRIVKALQKRNHFVAMTGDGVNDAPSLKAADIGVAMGITGADVSKKAADMILLDDNFTTIVKAVREGRRIYDNIRKFVKYIMTCNSAEILTIFLAPLVGLPIPLLPIHILWINLVTDGLPGLALASEKEERDIMKRPPRKTNESLFADGIKYHIVWVGILMAATSLLTLAISKQYGYHWQTMIFTVLAFSQLGHVLAIRSDREFLYKQGIFSNLPLVGAVVLTFFLQLIVIYLPEANIIFKTQPLTIRELFICLAVSSIVFHAVELEKWVRNNRSK
ncbi:MAG: cation-translocating P-type ATPase [Bacteroidetes bacterium]|nr:cation-translocating P-type ATPase [Bacteroidota bacterium]